MQFVVTTFVAKKYVKKQITFNSNHILTLKVIKLPFKP